jgi:hypothetical protein
MSTTDHPAPEAAGMPQQPQVAKQLKAAGLKLGPPN